MSELVIDSEAFCRQIRFGLQSADAAQSDAICKKRVLLLTAQFPHRHGLIGLYLSVQVPQKYCLFDALAVQHI